MSRQFKSTDTSKWLEGFGDGLDGDLTISGNTTEAPIDSSCSGTSGTTSLSATNASFAVGQIILIHKSRGNGTVSCGEWELNKIAGYTAGTITTKYPLEFSYNDSGNDQSQVRVLKQYNNVTVNTGITYTAKAWDHDIGGIIGWFAKGTTTITGTVQVSSKGFIGSNHGGAYANGQSGEGDPGAGPDGTGTINGSGGSGAQSNGGGGGHATAGGNASSGGVGGNAFGNAALTVIGFGGSGAGPGDGEASPSIVKRGGNSGGICMIFSSAFTMTGAITIAGEQGTSCAVSNEGGSGSGGACLIKCKTGVLGTNLITALGAAGYGSGGSGANGRIHVDYKTSLTGTTNPTLDSTNDLTLDYPTPGAAILYNFV